MLGQLRGLSGPGSTANAAVQIWRRKQNYRKEYNEVKMTTHIAVTSSNFQLHLYVICLNTTESIESIVSTSRP